MIRLPNSVGLAIFPFRIAAVEGSVWEAVELARQYKLDNLCAVVDVNRLGQSDPTMLQHDMEAYRARWSAFGWHALIVDGHDMAALVAAFEEASRTKQKPTVLLAKTFKGKGISFIEDHPNWHGKPIPQGAEMVECGFAQPAENPFTGEVDPAVTIAERAGVLPQGFRGERVHPSSSGLRPKPRKRLKRCQ